MSASLKAEAGVDGDDARAARDARRLAELDIARLRAANPGPLTLSGTNTWLLGSDPTWVVDPGPALEQHVERLLAAVRARGGLGGVALTHDHADHSGALAPLLREHPAPLAAAARTGAEVRLRDGLRFGPFEALATPGHAPDHFAFLARGACFTGDAVLGEGSVFVSPYPGSLSAYMRALRRLREREDVQLICPGHGPLVTDPRAKLDEYIEHREERERRLELALREGARSVRELLDSAWSEVPGALRPAATLTLAAHLDRLAERGLLPADVERPQLAGAQ